MVSKRQKQKLKEIEYLRLDFLNSKHVAYKKGIPRIIIEKWTNLMCSYLWYREMGARFDFCKYRETMNIERKKLEEFEIQNKL